MARRSKAVRVVSGQPFKEPYRLGVALAGSLILLFSAFCPLLQKTYLVDAYRQHVPSTTSLNLFVMHPGAATLLVVLVFLSIVLAVCRCYGFMWISVLLSLITLGFTIADTVGGRRDFYPGWGSAVAVIAMVMMLLSTKDRLPVRH